MEKLDLTALRREFHAQPELGWCEIATSAKIAQTLQKLGYGDMPLFYNMTFGHNDPKFLIPYGALAEMDAETGTFRILEPGVE